VDQFGILFAISIAGNCPKYKSLAGAFATAIISLSSLLYLVYILYLWGSD
jgi:hypothetical protein